MAEPASLVETSVSVTARLEAALRGAVDRVAARESRPGALVTRSDALRILLHEALAARGESVAA